MLKKFIPQSVLMHKSPSEDLGVIKKECNIISFTYLFTSLYSKSKSYVRLISSSSCVIPIDRLLRKNSFPSKYTNKLGLV